MYCCCHFKSILADEAGDAMDAREKMVIEAQKAVQTSFEAVLKADVLSTVCPEVDSYKFPDLCQPDETYEGEHRSQDVDENGDPRGEPYTIQYDDTRSREGKNAPKDLKMNPKYNVRTGDYLGYKIQPKTPQTRKVNNEICAADGVGDVFKTNAIGESKYGKLAETTSWQYFGGQETGLFAQYPTTVKTQCWCDSYDPRYRPWYSAAVTGPKDIILVLDKSGSMKEEVEIDIVNEAGEKEKKTVARLQIMKDAASALLNTVTFLDFVQVVVYSHSAQAYGTKLIRGTSANKKKLNEYIDKIAAGGSTCGKCGMEKAFDIFEASNNINQGDLQTSAGCERIISFLTDGKMNEDKWVSGWMVEKKRKLLGKNPHIFTYALGSGASTEIPAQLACENQGWFAQVEDGNIEALKHAMIRYFEYFASKIPPGNATLVPRWSEFYMDSSGQGKMSTVTLPVFTTGNGETKRQFVGVVGIDVLAKDFGSSLDDSKLAVKLQQRSNQCINYDFNITDDTSKVTGTGVAAAPGNCKIKPIDAKEPFIATGATLNEVPEGFCDRFPAWIVFVIIFPSIFCCCLFVCISYKCMAKQKHAIQPTPQKQQQPPHIMQQHGNNMGAERNAIGGGGIMQQNQQGQGQFYANQQMMNMQQQQQPQLLMQQQQPPILMQQPQYLGQNQQMMMQQQRLSMIQQQNQQTALMQQHQMLQPMPGGLQQVPINQHPPGRVIPIVQATPLNNQPQQRM